MNKIVDKINTTIEQGAPGVFNQFITPSVEDSPDTVKKDIFKNSLITILAIVIFIAIGAYIYTNILSKQVDSKKAQLAHYDTAPEVIYLEENFPEMKNLSQRLGLVNSVYDSQMYVASLLFPIIESLVESSHDSYVYFNSFNYRKSTDGNGSLVSLSGMAIDYPALYRQIQNFKNNPRIKNLRMASMNLEADGFVSFNVTFNISLSPTDYISYISNSLSAYEENESLGTGPLYQIEPVATSTEMIDNEEAEEEKDIEEEGEEEIKAEESGNTQSERREEGTGGSGLSDFLFGR